MFWNTPRRPVAGRRRFGLCRALTLGLSLGLALVGSGCGLLDVNDPTANDEEEIANAEVANTMRRQALAGFYGVWFNNRSALLTDEFFRDQSGPSMSIELSLDRRDQTLLAANEEVRSIFLQWNRTRFDASQALEQLRQNGAAAIRQVYVGQMFTVRGYSILGLAEHFCAGLPLGELDDGGMVFTAPLTTTAAVLERALTAFDSAVVYTADSARLLRAAQVGRARTLLGLGRFAEAATAAGEAAVPTNFVWSSEAEPAWSSYPNAEMGALSGSLISVADQEGGNGLDYVSAGDPRVPTDSVGMAFDGVTTLYGNRKYLTWAATIVLASGIEARLIEAEARLNTTPGGGEWLTILNTLRTTCTDPTTCSDPAPAGTGGVAGLPPLTDPGSQAARVDLVFRERAFWLYLTGHRLGDLRRLVRLYGRNPETVFPTGPYRLGGSYGTATSLPFPVTNSGQYGEGDVNPAVTGCTEQ